MDAGKHRSGTELVKSVFRLFCVPSRLAAAKFLTPLLDGDVQSPASCVMIEPISPKSETVRRWMPVREKRVSTV
ncbi:hypothetical protein BH20ACI2_BH20ACI2_02460 [soil metagenome]